MSFSIVMGEKIWIKTTQKNFLLCLFVVGVRNLDLMCPSPRCKSRIRPNPNLSFKMREGHRYTRLHTPTTIRLRRKLLCLLFIFNDVILLGRSLVINIENESDQQTKESRPIQCSYSGCAVTRVQYYGNCSGHCNK